MKFQNYLNQFGEWVYRLTVLNFLWIIFSIAGFGFFGIFPATSAIFAVIRQYQLGNKNIKLFSSFCHYYKQDFVTANSIGYIYILMILVAWVDYRYLLAMNNYWIVSMSLVVLVATIVILLASVLVFSLFVHYDLPIWKTVTNPFRFMVCHMRRTLALIGIFVLWGSLVNQLPGVILFLGVSFPVFLVQLITEDVLMAKKSKKKLKQSRTLMSKEDVLYYL
ncbi:YesL family protein [Aerococcaceae bacterium WGS1372]